MTTHKKSISCTSSGSLLALLTLVVICVGALPTSSASANARFDGQYSLRVRNTSEYRGQQYRGRDAGSFNLRGTRLTGRTLGRDGMVDIFTLRLSHRPRQRSSQNINASGRVTIIDSRGRRSYGNLTANLRFRVSNTGRILITGSYYIRVNSGQYRGAILYGTIKAKK